MSKDALLSDCQVILHTLTACEELDAQIAEITREIEVVVAGLWIIIRAVGAISTLVPAMAITEAADAAKPSIFTVTLPL